MFVLFNYLATYSRDTFFEVLLFLPPEDACRLGRVSKLMLESTRNEQLWSIYCSERIEGFKDVVPSLKQLLALRHILHIESYRHLYEAFRQLQFPFFGWFRLIPPDLSTCHGGLYCIYPTQGKILCQYVDCNGDGINDDRSLNIMYDKTQHSLISKSISGSRKYYTTFSRTVSFLNSISRQSVVMKPLPPILSPSIAGNGNVWESFVSCLGLFTSRYGSHGLEILHLSLHSTSDASALQFDNFQFSGLQLQGLKITGDRNVPAGEFSFCIDIMNTVELTQPLMQDTRPIVMFPPDRDNPVLTNWQQRMPMMAFWTKGLGQINRVPGVWNPEWVTCSFVLYKLPVGEHRASFSIVWDDENDIFRHAMDFQSLPEGNMCKIDQSIYEMET